MSIQLADQLFVLDENDKIVSSKIVREKFHEEKQQAGQWTYYLFQPAHEEEGFKEVLFRVDEQKNPEEYEIVAEGVKDYFIMEDKVYYVKDGMIEIELVSQTYEPVHFSYDIAMKEDGFYLVNQLGNVVDKQDGIVELGDMEGFRYYDLMRWKEGQCMAQSFKGFYLPATAINKAYDIDGDGTNDVCFYTTSSQPNVGSVTYVKLASDGSGTSLSEGNYGNLLCYSWIDRTWNENRDYLYPVPRQEITLSDGVVTQNPGWNE